MSRNSAACRGMPTRTQRKPEDCPHDCSATKRCTVGGCNRYLRYENRTGLCGPHWRALSFFDKARLMDAIRTEPAP